MKDVTKRMVKAHAERNRCDNDTKIARHKAGLNLFPQIWRKATMISNKYSRISEMHDEIIPLRLNMAISQKLCQIFCFLLLTAIDDDATLLEAGISLHAMNVPCNSSTSYGKKTNSQHFENFSLAIVVRACGQNQVLGDGRTSNNVFGWYSQNLRNWALEITAMSVSESGLAISDWEPQFVGWLWLWGPKCTQREEYCVSHASDACTKGGNYATTPRCSAPEMAGLLNQRIVRIKKCKHHRHKTKLMTLKNMDTRPRRCTRKGLVGRLTAEWGP